MERTLPCVPRSFPGSILLGLCLTPRLGMPIILSGSIYCFCATLKILRINISARKRLMFWLLSSAFPLRDVIFLLFIPALSCFPALYSHSGPKFSKIPQYYT
ncbi:hypothetical protein B0H19DRAFT_1175860 [Mycena capillaripes]|nr:hypothetical protein B0H19DRAFT_1175860 [Mycena capillaripes]